MSPAYRPGSLANRDWAWIHSNDDRYDWPRIQAEILLDIRAELRKLNATLDCKNFQQIPIVLQQIRDLLAEQKPKRKPRRKVKR